MENDTRDVIPDKALSHYLLAGLIGEFGDESGSVVHDLKVGFHAIIGMRASCMFRTHVEVSFVTFMISQRDFVTQERQERLVRLTGIIVIWKVKQR